MTAPASPTAILKWPRRLRRAGPKHARHLDAGRPDPRLVLLLACGTVFITTLDLTVVNVAFPDLQADFPTASLPTLSWVVTAYGVMFAALLAGAGRVADVVGQQRLFTWSLMAFTVMSGFAAIAPDEKYLILFRALQGLAAAGMSPTTLGLILAWIPGERLMTAIGTWGAAASVAAAIGPTVGGTLTEAWGWRAIFMINVPVGLAMFYGAVTGLGRDTPGERRLPDVFGTALFAVGVGGIVVGLSQGSEWGWTSRPLQVSLVGGAVCVGAALARSARHPVPALELDLWRNRTFTLANTTAALVNAAAFASVLNGTIFLTTAWGYSEFEAGLALTPGAFASALGAVVLGKRMTTPAVRRVVIVASALLVAAASLVMWAELGAEKRYVEVFLPASTVAGAGFGAALTALFGAGATSIPPTRFASGSGLLTMARQLGGVFGVAVAAAVLAAPGYSSPVDPFPTVYLFCAVAALAGAATGANLPRGDSAVEPTGEPATAVAARRRRGVVAMTCLAALVGAGMFSLSVTTDSGRDNDGDSGGGPAAATTPAPSQEPAPIADSRNFVLIDVSASMGEPSGAGVAGLPAATLAVAAGVGPAPGTTEVGVWLFGSHLWGDLDWVQLLPVGPLDERLGEATRRDVLQAHLSKLGAVPDDRLGLHDSVLAAFRATTGTYRPGVPNNVVLFTDGRDDDPTGITLDSLLAALEAESDPSRPVHVNVIGYGDGVDRDELARIAETTGGQMYAATSAHEAQQFFSTVVSGRS